MNFKKGSFGLSRDNIEDILTRIKPQLISKSGRSDSDRLVYQELLSFAVSYLEKQTVGHLKNQKNASSSLEGAASQFFYPLFEEMINLSKRQCNEKSTLLKLLLEFYREGTAMTQKTCHQKMKSLTFEYIQNCQQIEDKWSKQHSELRYKLKRVEEESDRKWKMLHTIVRDNRVLRRQKGKLLRVVQQQRTKISNMHAQMMQLTRQNEKTRLLMNYQHQKQSLSLFISNNLCLNKLEHFMKDYPRVSKKLLKQEMHQLEVAEKNSLNDKVEYILKMATEGENIYNEEEDLIDISRPNKILFNVGTQIQKEDIEVQSYKEIFCQERSQKIIKIMRLQSHLGKVTIDPKVIERQNRRRVEFIKSADSLKYKLASKIVVRKQLTLVQQVVNRKIFFKIEKKQLTIESEVIDECFKFSCETHQLLSINQISRRQRSKGSRKMSRLSGLRDQFASDQAKNSNFLNFKQNNAIQSLANIKTQRVSGSKDSQKKRKGRFSRVSEQGQGLMFSDRRNSANNFFHNEKRSSTNSSQRISKLSKEIVFTEPFELKLNSIKIDERDETISQQNSHNEITVKNIEDKPVREQSSDSSSQSSKQMISQKQLKVIPQKTIATLQSQAKKYTPLRKSGFALNLSKKPHFKKSQLQSHTLRINNQSSVSQFSQITNNKMIEPVSPSANWQSKKQLSIDNQSLFIKERKIRVNTQQKVVNIFGVESSRTVDKLLKGIYTQRRELSQGKITFEQFIRIFMTNHYGSQHQFVLSNRITNKSLVSPLSRVFDRLLDNNRSAAHLQMSFGLFARIISFNGSLLFEVDAEQFDYIQNQLATVYGQNVRVELSNQITTLYDLFFQVQMKLDQTIKDSQLFQFIELLLPLSQQFLTFDELKGLFSIFQGNQEYLKYFFALKQQKSQLSRINLCIFAFKINWHNLINIKTFIDQRYKQLCGQFDPDIYEMMVEDCESKSRQKSLYNLLNCCLKKVRNEGQRQLLIKYICLLFVSNEVEKMLPLSTNLTEISNQYENLLLRLNFD